MGSLGLLAIVASSAFASFLATSVQWAGTPVPWIAVALPLVLTLGVGCSQRRIRENLLERLRGRGLDISKGFLLAAALYGATWLVSQRVCAPGTPRVGWLVSIYGQLGDPRAFAAHSTVVPVAILLLALLEETVWRGVVTILLEEKIGSRFAWIVAALLYALAQVPTLWSLGAWNPLLVLAALFLGLVLGGVAAKTGRLGLGIFAHALYVWAICVSFPLWTLKGAT